jgi:hypothetical protein
VVEVGDELAEDPRLVWVGDAAMPVLHDGLGDDAPPRQVPQRDLAQLRAVHVDRRVLGAGGDLVGDRHDGADAVLARDVDVARDLLVGQARVADLDLDQRSPARLAPFDDDRAVGRVALPLGVPELNFGVGRDPALGGAERAEQRVPELWDSAQNGEQGRRRALLLLFLAADPRDGDQSCLVPVLADVAVSLTGCHARETRPLSAARRRCPRGRERSTCAARSGSSAARRASRW